MRRARSRGGVRIALAVLCVGGAIGSLAVLGPGAASAPGDERAENPSPRDPSIDAGPEAAVRMVDRLERFRAGGLGRRITMDAAEVTALLRHVAPGMLPAGVSEPAVGLSGSRVLLRARVAPEALPGGGHLGAARSAMPELVDVELRGRVLPHGTGRVAYRIDHASVEGIALPASVVARVVRSWPGGVVDGRPDAPRSMVTVRWPLPDTRVRVAGGRLVLERYEPILSESVDGIDGV